MSYKGYREKLQQEAAAAVEVEEWAPVKSASLCSPSLPWNSATEPSVLGEERFSSKEEKFLALLISGSIHHRARSEQGEQ